ncbi:MAG: 2,3-bisphosphoglycerate-independent phosphoglycerate mutase [Candidatus Tectomicrobia bacterium]|uniref:2,3-bisphosphoglycerate-independent phosphoglycerate mutase n=1 Tax=Tectimicrobiota bacterium TaxID=2528274 RepID=A0A932FWF0_UNCTE|nr:2,3-bisphosphoglycerate-independent phosphoglycerate mutase [Candidatus Tectomicrobia bacterium]
MSPVIKPLILIILDGWGLSPKQEGNAIAQARTPTMDLLYQQYPWTTLQASGEEVGLPRGLMGNSEVGHLNIGAGRVVYQDIARISQSIEAGEFFRNPALTRAVDRAVREGKCLHLLGLLSDGGVHSTLEHLAALLKLARERGLTRVYLHPFLDGRDTPPTKGAEYLGWLLDTTRQLGVGRIATVMGRYYAMDRDKRWDRLQRAYLAMVEGQGEMAVDPVAAVRCSYERQVTDEFVEPIVLTAGTGRPVGLIEEGDSVIFFNFRADRAREITSSLTRSDFTGFDRGRYPQVHYVCLTEYDERFALPIAFPSQNLDHILAQVLAHHGLPNLRIAETEKYAHVTFFFNGGQEKAYPGEDRILVPSPQVATYDLQPEMSCPEVTEQVLEALSADRYPLVVLNYANPDMVGHTGVLPAAIQAVETVDRCLGRVIACVREKGGVALISSDHGNVEQMIDPETGGPHTAHTTHPVPFIWVSDRQAGGLREGGALKDIAPTILGLLGIPQPPEMTGQDLRAVHPPSRDA